MKSLIISPKLLLFLITFLFIAVSAGGVSAEMSPRNGVITTPTGAPIPGVTVVEYTDVCPNDGVMQSSYPQCPVKENCYAERTTKTNADGYYFFEPLLPAIPAEPMEACGFTDWRRFTCSNNRVFYKIRVDPSAQANSFIKSASAQSATDLCPPPIKHPTDNTSAVITTNMTCPPPVACNSVCQSDTQCAYAAGGCTSCIEGLCKPPSACNTSCERDGQCAGSKDGCTVCLPNDAGTGKVCKPPAACNVSCTRDDQCTGAKDGCTSCLPSDTGTGNVCRPTAACNVACTKDSQCAGAKDGCTTCVNGSCRVPPACGTACTSKAECSGAKDGCSECEEGTCTDYNKNMCKCDGIVADLTYPSDSFKFEAFGKVEGGDIKKAEIADITFRLTKDQGQVIAKSNPITPEIVENSAGKLRFKAAWQTPPPPVAKGSTYRVFADVRCKPKRIVADASQTSSPVPVAVKSFTPKGLELIANAVNKLAGNNNDQIKAFTAKVLASFSTPTVSAQGTDGLQLRTLNFVKLMDTDNCRFVMFKYDESLF